eukprot:CAMPEP_0119036210 /NCGR_PEP_ID=MMETSP1177-20130426/3740_1 /TAXON_ID=2985 /ORGANISM="Ochromonas sp, Strain CCMP1899" /LENGTH=480 /DNA_ID=CAMNT_0006995673 /DNA_START=149 /DNA_END=1591 /DNA_ORIENTATION=-
MSSSSHAEPEPTPVFDLLVVGGGSGGIACAKRSSSYGANVAIVESARWGGTCVNVGCVPKKIMFNASHVAETIKEAHQFGFKDIAQEVKFDWLKMKTIRDRYIGRLNGIYDDGLEKLNVTRILGEAKFTGLKTVVVNGQEYTAKHILVAVGGTPNKIGVPGEDLVINSDGFFDLEVQPKKVGVIGAGYIAVELAGVFNGLGTDTSLFVRKETALRTFDEMIVQHLDKNMKHAGINLVSGAVMKEIVKEADGTMTVHLENGASHSGFDCLLGATGRSPLTQTLGLEHANVKQEERSNYITVDDYQNTSAEGVYALGDVCGQIELTPMAIAAGRRLADRLFGGMPDAKADYHTVPTVVFSHPPIATVGLTQDEAIKAHGVDKLKIYTSSFVNLWYGQFFEGGPGDKPITKYKVICVGPEEKVIGIHLIGMASDEVIQGFAVAMKMGCTKADLDSCIAIHPSAGEELVTLPVWGMSGAKKLDT